MKKYEEQTAEYCKRVHRDDVVREERAELLLGFILLALVGVIWYVAAN